MKTYTQYKDLFGTTLLHRFVRASHRTTSSNLLTCDSGITVCKILKFFHLPITRSTWILARESCQDVSTWCAESCIFPFVKWGMRRLVPWAASSSLIRKLLIPRPWAPKVSKNQILWWFCLSDTTPPRRQANKSPLLKWWRLNIWLCCCACNWTMSGPWLSNY